MLPRYDAAHGPVVDLMLDKLILAEAAKGTSKPLPGAVRASIM